MEYILIILVAFGAALLTFVSGFGFGYGFGFGDLFGGHILGNFGLIILGTLTPISSSDIPPRIGGHIIFQNSFTIFQRRPAGWAGEPVHTMYP